MKRSYGCGTIRTALAIGLAAGTVAACTALSGAPRSGEEPPHLYLSSFFPGDGEISGWRADEPVFVALDLAELTSRINGGAPYYIDRGVVDSAFCTYVSDGGSLLEIQVYRAAFEKQARDLYEDGMPSGYSPLDLPSGEGFIEKGTFGALSARIIVGQTYALLWVNGMDQAARAALTDFASRMARAAATEGNEK